MTGTNLIVMGALLNPPSCPCWIGQGCRADLCPAWYCEGDFDCSGDVGISDLVVVLQNWGYVGLSCCSGDADCDGHRSAVDIVIVLTNIAEGCGS